MGSGEKFLVVYPVTEYVQDSEKAWHSEKFFKYWDDNCLNKGSANHECLDGIGRLMNSDYREPINIGSDFSISIEDLVLMVADIAGKRIGIEYIPGPVGVQGRNSDNTLIKEKLNWAPSQPLRVGMTKLYRWVETQVLTERAA